MSLKGIKQTEEHKAKRIMAMRPFYRRLKGSTLSEETRRKISTSLKGGNTSSFKKGDQTGSKHHQWKGGISKARGYGNFYKYRHLARKKGAQGSHTLSEWENLKTQYNWTCPCCRKSEPEIKLTEDHIIPLARGGSDNIENIQPLCRRCNSRKFTDIIKFSL